MICIYLIRNLANGKVYIGQTINYRRRKNNHISKLNAGRHFNMYLQKAWNKYGANAFQFEMLEECEVRDLDKKEREYIKLYKCSESNSGYNLMTGGQKYRHFTDDVKKRMSIAGTGRVFTDSHKQKLSEAAMNRPVDFEAARRGAQTRIKNRSGCGEKNGNALISNNVARNIVLDLLNNAPVNQVAEKYQVPQQIVYSLMYNRTYRDILPEHREELSKRTTNLLSAKIELAVGLYRDGKSQNSIAQEVGISRNTLRRELKLRGIDTFANQYNYRNE